MRTRASITHVSPVTSTGHDAVSSSTAIRLPGTAAPINHALAENEVSRVRRKNVENDSSVQHGFCSVVAIIAPG